MAWEPFCSSLTKREVFLEEWEEDDFDNIIWEDIYLYHIKFNIDKKIYEVTTEVWKSPKGRTYLRFRNGEVYEINRGPVYVLTTASWAVRRPLSDEEIERVFKQELRKVVDKECEKIRSYLDYEVVRKNTGKG